MVERIQELERELKALRSKHTCKFCKGVADVILNGRCPKCAATNCKFCQKEYETGCEHCGCRVCYDCSEELGGHLYAYRKCKECFTCKKCGNVDTDNILDTQFRYCTTCEQYFCGSCIAMCTLGSPTSKAYCGECYTLKNNEARLRAFGDNLR